MSDDDDFFTDDICFDDQTLAILDHEEQKYLSQAVRTVPPTKRQKTDTGWTAGIGTAGIGTPSVNVSEFLPEISLNLGGSYGILPSTSNSAGIPPRPLSNSRPTARPPSNQYLPQKSRPVQLVPSGSLHNIPARSIQHSRPPAQPSKQQPHSEIAGLAHDTHLASISPPPNTLPSNLSSEYDDRKHALEAQLQELQQRLDKMGEENKNIQIALNEARDAKLAKEGEVTVLRRNAEKVAQEHAVQLNKLKVAREEADAKQARIQKDLRDEAERLKTQLVFKQHEQESTIKPPPSVRSKKILKDASFAANSTPLRLRGQAQQSEPRGLKPMERGSHLPNQPRNSPRAKKTSMLPGFENAFNDVTALRLSPRFNQENPTVSKNSLRQPLAQPDFVLATPTKYQGPELSVDADVSMDGWVNETYMESAHVDTDGDIDMPFGTVELDSHTKVEDEGMEMTHVMGPSDWKVELNRIVLMHILPSAHTLTIQLLLGVQAMSILDGGPLDAYITACSRCVQTIASTIQIEQDWRYVVESLSHSLLSIIPLLRTTQSLLPLAALLNLLAVLIYSLPDFASSVLSEPCDAGISDSRILVYLSEIILEHREMEKQDSREAVATEAVTLLEALAYTVSPELVERLAYISHNRQVLMNLFRANQPPWLLARSARLLVILASHHKLCRFLLSMPDPEHAVEEKTADPQKIPLIERLCLYLIDAGRKDPDYKEVKTSILTFFALLSNSRPDVHAHLLMSTTVIPSLVFFLAQLTTAFWEDDEELVSASPEDVSVAIQTLNQALFLLHHFVFTSVSFINLRQKLHAPYHRIFNGLIHMFIVTFGRLSYGEAPEWIHRQGRIDLVSSTDMARDILDHVVDGPEADRTWQAYQIEGERSGDTDEEEMEEQLLGERI
ncbi:hypothetical protein E4T56_gene18246 [Termitomyces sp. T112]|nr:hypothetical protein E4T56_gene18246 [Termitomyces sp. T112]